MASGSDILSIRENTIKGGAGNGITLGSDLVLDDLTRMATDRQSFIEEEAIMVWTLFEKLVEPVEAAHAALAIQVQDSR